MKKTTMNFFAGVIVIVFVAGTILSVGFTFAKNGKSQEKSQSGNEQKTEQKVQEKKQVRTEEKVQQKTGEDDVGKTQAKSEEKTREIVQEEVQVKTQQKTQEKTQMKSGKDIEDQMGGEIEENDSKSDINIDKDVKSIEKGNNAKKYKDNVSSVNKNLGDVVNKVKDNNEIVEEIEDVIEENEDLSEEVVDAIDKVENRNKFKQFLAGSDYKNLGQLRSNLVQNRNQIRKLEQVMEGLELEEREVIEEQLKVLNQERGRLRSVISDNESGFSVLGWAFRFMNGYPKDSIDEVNDEEMDDSEEIIENENDDEESEEVETEKTE